jgi:hypothetical protein
LVTSRVLGTVMAQLAPFGLRMPSGWQEVFTVALVVPFVGLGALAVATARRLHSPLPLVMLLAGACCTVLEPIVDVLGKCWYPAIGQNHLFTTFGRPMPLWVLFGYAWFMGGLTLVTFLVIEARGVRALLRLYPVLILIEAPFELFAVHTHVYVYYGAQPLDLWAWPVWWGFVNTAIPILSAVLITSLRTELRGSRALLVLAIIPMIDGGVNAGTAWPVWTVLHSSVPTWERQGAGLLTCALGFLAVRGAIVLGELLLAARTDHSSEQQRVLLAPARGS